MELSLHYINYHQHMILQFELSWYDPIALILLSYLRHYTPHNMEKKYNPLGIATRIRYFKYFDIKTSVAILFDFCLLFTDELHNVY